MKRRTLYVAITVITLGVFCVSSLGLAVPPQIQRGQQPQFSQVPGKMGRPGPEMRTGLGRGQAGMQMNWKELGLSEEQQAQMQQFNKEFRVNTAGIREELKFAQQDLRTEMMKETVDRAKIDSILSDIAALKQKLSEARTQNMLAIKGILTQEQVEKLLALRQPVPKELRGVNLTAEQRSQIGTIMKSSQEKSRAMRDELRDLKEQFQELLIAAGEPDSAKLQQVQTDILTKEAALEKERVDMLLQLKEVLTPEQQEQLKQVRQAKQGKAVRARIRR